MSYSKTTLDSFPESGWYSFIWTSRSKDKLTYGNVDLKACNSGNMKRHLIVTEGVWDCYRKQDTYGLECIHSVTKVSVLCDEIQKYLPEDHPDKITHHDDKKFLKGTWYRNLINKCFYLCNDVSKDSFFYKEYINPDTCPLRIIKSALGIQLPLDSFNPDMLADYNLIYAIRPPGPAVIRHPAKSESLCIPPTVEELLSGDIATPINNPEGHLMEIDNYSHIPEKWAIEVVHSSDSYPELLEWRKKYSAAKCNGWAAPGYLNHLGFWGPDKPSSCTLIFVNYFIKNIYTKFKQKEELRTILKEEEEEEALTVEHDFGFRGEFKSVATDTIGSMHGVNEESLPKKWCVRVDASYTSYPLISQWRHDFPDKQWSNPGYIRYNKQWTKEKCLGDSEISLKAFITKVFNPFIKSKHDKENTIKVDFNFSDSLGQHTSPVSTKIIPEIKVESMNNISIFVKKPPRTPKVQEIKNITI